MSVDTNLIQDVVIVIPGIMGSALVDVDGTPIWSFKAGALIEAIKTLGGSIKSLTLPDGVVDEAPPKNRIRAAALLPSLHVIPGLWSPITGYDGTMAFLRSKRFQMIEPDGRNPDRIPNLLQFPYDWRLSNRYNARLLKQVAEDALGRWREQPGMQESKLVLICHSMGGLVARWFLEKLGGASITRTLITIGTPHRGAGRALDTLSNGLEPGIGPLRLKLSDFARSLPSMYQLLPTYDCLTMDGGIRVSLHGRDIPNLNSEMQKNALEFHAALDAAPPPSYALHKVVGIRQPTLTTASLVHGRIVASEEIDRLNQGGDGTVPRLSAEPAVLRGKEVHEVADQHGELQGTRAALDLIDGILTRSDVVWQSAPAETFGVSMNELWTVGEPPRLQIVGDTDSRLRVTIVDEFNEQVGAEINVSKSGSALLPELTPGGYHAKVSSVVAGGPAAVTKPFLVWDEPAVPS